MWTNLCRGASSFAVCLLFALLLPGSAGAQEGPIDLLSQYDIRIDGEQFDQAGTSVDGAEDVDGDGTPDVVVGAPFADHNTRTNSGSAFVMFGDPSPQTIDLADAGTTGFFIDGQANIYRTGTSVAGAGDVNDDGLEDVIVGAPGADNNSRADSGSAYVVFGKSSTTSVDLASLGAAGFRIDGALAGDEAGTAVSGVRDMNDDGMDDVIVGAPFADNNSRDRSGSAYVIFGKGTTGTIDLASLGTAGFRIDGAVGGDVTQLGDETGISVDGARDVNDDGTPDVVVGAPYSDNSSRIGGGSAYVVFGKETTSTIDLASLGTAGFRIDGADLINSAGNSVGGARDVNDDGMADVVVGAPNTDNNSRTDSGSAYVVFGKADSDVVDLASLGSGGFRIDGATASEATFEGAGYAVAGANDVNNDGMNDVIVGALEDDSNDRESSGSAYVIFGKTGTGSVDLASLAETRGFRIDGAAEDDQASYSVGGAGDIDNDGRDDVLVGAPKADNNSLDISGSAYIELVADWLGGDCANPRSGTDGDDTLIGGVAGDDITGDDGADDLRGEEGDDCVKGQKGQDTVNGNEKDDEVKGGDGNDPSVRGGDGDDQVEGGDGNDTLDGGDGIDDLLGDTGDDTAEGGENGDTIEGNDGEDTLKGEEGGDTLKGGANADTLKGGDGADTLKGNDGGDTITGGDGKDTIEAGDGNDEINADDGEKDTIECGSGNDDVDKDSKDVLIGC
jgi:hypothetical protein